MKEKGRAVPPKAKTSRSEQKETTREQILEAATTLLAEHGYAALRVAAVASKKSPDLLERIGRTNIAVRYHEDAASS